MANLDRIVLIGIIFVAIEDYMVYHQNFLIATWEKYVLLKTKIIQ